MESEGINLLFEPWHGISNNVVCVTSKASDQPAHTRSLIRAITCRLNILWVLGILWNLYVMFIFILNKFYTNMVGITVYITKLWTFNWRYTSVCRPHCKLFCYIFRERWVVKYFVFIFISFNCIKYCHLFVEWVFLIQVMTKYLV